MTDRISGPWVNPCRKNSNAPHLCLLFSRLHHITLCQWPAPATYIASYLDGLRTKSPIVMSQITKAGGVAKKTPAKRAPALKAPRSKSSKQATASDGRATTLYYITCREHRADAKSYFRIDFGPSRSHDAALARLRTIVDFTQKSPALCNIDDVTTTLFEYKLNSHFRWHQEDGKEDVYNIEAESNNADCTTHADQELFTVVHIHGVEDGLKAPTVVGTFLGKDAAEARALSRIKKDIEGACDMTVEKLDYDGMPGFLAFRPGKEHVVSETYVFERQLLETDHGKSVASSAVQNDTNCMQGVIWRANFESNEGYHGCFFATNASWLDG